jgi:hypothetical protein
MDFLVPGLPLPYARALPVISLTSVQRLATIFHPGSSSGLVNLLSVSTLLVEIKILYELIEETDFLALGLPEAAVFDWYT